MVLVSKASLRPESHVTTRFFRLCVLKYIYIRFKFNSFAV